MDRTLHHIGRLLQAALVLGALVAVLTLFAMGVQWFYEGKVEESATRPTTTPRATTTAEETGPSTPRNAEETGPSTPRNAKAPDLGGFDLAALTSSGAVFVHTATRENTSANSTYLDNPLTNGNPGAVLLVTQNWNPGGGSGTYNDHPVGVWYDPGRKRWAIFNQDRAAIPVGADFNVAVAVGPNETGQ